MKASVAVSMKCYPFAASGMQRSIAFKKTSAPEEVRLFFLEVQRFLNEILIRSSM